MDIFLRPPSASWEPLSLPDVPGAVWAWFRPPAAPCGIVVQIPKETCASNPEAFTVRRLLSALGIDCRQLRMCFTSLDSFDAMQGLNPLLDRPLEAPAANVDPVVTIHLAPPMAFATQRPAAIQPVMGQPVVNSYSCAQPAQTFRSPSCGGQDPYHAIESDWHAIQILESKNLTLRKQLNAMLTKFMTLNRDLSPEERNNSDSQDHRDWQEARRWLRDGASVLSRIVRLHDIGVTSAAGQRNKFDDLISHYITPRVPLPNLAEIQHQFEVHRKTVQSLNTEMQSSMHGPVRDGELKAQAVLGRIRAKVQAARGKK